MPSLLLRGDVAVVVLVGGSGGCLVISTRLGHADPAVTMQVYAHAPEGDDSTAAETTATAIFGP